MRTDVPYFLWSDTDEISEAELRQKLKSADAPERALWLGRVMREARFEDVWQYVTLTDVLRDWPLVEKHLGRSRDFWRFMLDGWRRLGLIAG